jgi:hypothetical protein
MEKPNFERLIGWADIAKGVGEVVFHSIFRMPHALSTHGDHFIPYEHPLDTPIEPVTELYGGRWDSEGTYYEAEG